MSNNNNKNKSFRERHPFLVNSALMLLALIALGYIALLFIDVFTSHGQQVQVPDVRNLPLEKAIEILDDAGFPFVTADADCKVELSFSGPSESGGDMAKEFATVVFSIFTANYNVETWGANLKIRDAKSGKVLFRHEYTERASAAVWGPIPIFSPAFADATDSSVLRSRALSSLTDRAMADATAFLAAFNMPQAQ